MAGPVQAFNHAQGSAAAVVGPARSRIRQIVIFASAAGAFTIKRWKRFRFYVTYTNISDRLSSNKHSQMMEYLPQVVRLLVRLQEVAIN